jgi:hypothetical protein
VGTEPEVVFPGAVRLGLKPRCKLVGHIGKYIGWYISGISRHLQDASHTIYHPHVVLLGLYQLV